MKTAYVVKLLDSIARLEAMKIWNPVMGAFLRKTAVVDLLIEIMLESKKEADEAVLVFLSALRYLDIRYGQSFTEDTISDSQGREINLELFLVQKHASLVDLCVNRKVQANVTARAFPVLEVLASKISKPVRIIELGCSAGLLGKVFVHASEVVDRHGEFCVAGQQLPKALPQIDSYWGYDLELAEVPWVIACVHEPELRTVIKRLSEAFATSANYSLYQDSALNFPQMKELEAPKQGVVDVILTSYVLYQLPLGVRASLEQKIREYCAQTGSAWINLDLSKDVQGQNRFYLAFNREIVYNLSDDYCRAWSPVAMEDV